jgi:16S rRNA processing protein RimM
VSGDRVQVGRVGRSHGIHGAFVVERPSDSLERYAVGATLLVAGEPATVVESKRAGGRVVIRFDRPVERGAEIEVPLEQLGPPAPDSYYVFQLVGLAVEEAGGRQLGRVAAVQPGVANDVLELDSGLALPMVEDCIERVDVGGGRIVVARGFADAG